MSDPITTPPGTVPVDRPNPLKQVTILLAPGMAAVTAVLTYLVSQGLVSQAVADAVNAVGYGVTGAVNDSATATSAEPVWAAVAAAVIAAAGAALTAVLHAKLARPKVTPVGDERAADGTRLVRPETPTSGVTTGPATSPGFRPDLRRSTERGTHERPEGTK